MIIVNFILVFKFINDSISDDKEEELAKSKGRAYDNFKCSICGHRTDNIYSANDHYYHCSNRISKKKDLKGNTVDDWQLKVNRAYSCRLCDMNLMFEEKSQLEIHLNHLHFHLSDENIRGAGYSA